MRMDFLLMNYPSASRCKFGLKRLLKLAALLLSSVTLAQCQKQSSQNVSRKEQSAPLPQGEGWPAHARFSFEVAAPRTSDLTVHTEDSPLVAETGNVYQAAPGQGVIGPFALGMTSDQVEAIIIRDFPGQYVDGDPPGLLNPLACREVRAGSSANLLRIIPSRMVVPARVSKGPVYQLQFIDDGGVGRLSSIIVQLEASYAGAASMVAHMSHATRTRGKGAMGVQGDELFCRVDRVCDPTSSDEIPGGSLRHYRPTKENPTLADYTVWIGHRAERKAGDLTYRQTAMGTKGDCTARLGAGPTKAYRAYIGALAETWAPAGPLIFRHSDLPAGVGALLTLTLDKPWEERRILEPDWIRPVGQGFLASYRYVENGDPVNVGISRYRIVWPSADGKLRVVRDFSLMDGMGRSLFEEQPPSAPLPAQVLQLIARLQVGYKEP